MEQQYVSPIEGIEVERSDFDLVSKNAAWADDRILSELLRLLPVQTPATRGILAASSFSFFTISAVVTAKGTADSRVYINPFRALVGYSADATTVTEQYQNIRSALYVGGEGVLFAALQLAAATNNRWDLIYARVDIDVPDTVVNRYVKDTSDNVSSEATAVTKSTSVVVSVLQGTEATSPIQPAVPADSGTSYYIPLAYVLLPAGHTLTSTINVANIQEVAPVLHLHRATGAASLRVADGMNAPAGIAMTNEGWTVASGRPRTFMPATMGGKEELVFTLHLQNSAAPITIPLNSTGIIDDSTDWRYRLWKCTATAGGVTSYLLPFESGGFSAWLPDGGGGLGHSGTESIAVLTMAQSFKGGNSTPTNKAVLLVLTPGNTANQMATGSSVTIYVDMTDGTLKCDVSSVDPAADFFFWFEATGQFNNCF